MGCDWTADIRSTHSVVEYLMVGETDEGICGRPWETWGVETAIAYGESSSESESDTDESRAGMRKTPRTPPYTQEGFARVELEHISQIQICRTDERWSSRRHSHTVSFRRMESRRIRVTRVE
jgi:hypothetical protein